MDLAVFWTAAVSPNLGSSYPSFKHLELDVWHDFATIQPSRARQRDRGEAADELHHTTRCRLVDQRRRDFFKIVPGTLPQWWAKEFDPCRAMLVELYRKMVLKPYHAHEAWAYESGEAMLNGTPFNEPNPLDDWITFDAIMACIPDWNGGAV